MKTQIGICSYECLSIRSNGKVKKGNWKRRQIVWVFWSDGCISELCEKWICLNDKYAYTKFEELRTHSSKVFFTRERKATVSKDKSDTYIDIDDPKMFKDFSTSDKTTFKTKTKTMTKDKNKTKTEDKNKTTTKTKTENKDLLDNINNKICFVCKFNKCLTKLEVKITKKVELIYEAIHELQDEIYSDDSWLRLVELNKIDIIIDEALLYGMLYGIGFVEKIE